MAKQTLILQRQGRAEGRIGLDETRVYVLHPDDPLQIVEMPHATEAAARATMQTVIKRFFDPRLGWKVARQLDEIDLDTWRPKPTRKPPTRSPEEIAAEEGARRTELEAKKAALRSRQLGWIVDGRAMVLLLEKQTHDGDLEIALVDNARAISTLHVLVTPEDDDGVGRAKMFARLQSDGVPHLEVLTLESGADYERNRREPRGYAYELARRPMPGLTALLEMRPLRELAALGRFDLPSARAMQSLERLRIHDESLSMASFERIGDARQLRVLQLIAGPSVRDGIARLPIAQLDELALEWVDDVAATLDALLATRRDRFPPIVHVQGEPGAMPALHAAIERWRREAPASTLTFGAFAKPVDTLGIEQRVSAFSPAGTLRGMAQPWTAVRELLLR